MEYLTIDRLPRLNANLAAYDRGALQEIAFVSAFGFSSYMEEYGKTINQKGKELAVSGRYFRTKAANMYDIVITKVPGSDYSHMIASIKDTVANQFESGEAIVGHIFFSANNCIDISGFERFENAIEDGTFPEELYDKFYDKLYKLSPVPVIRDWMPVLLREMSKNGYIREYAVSGTDADKTFHAFQFDIQTSALRNIISEELKKGTILISNHAGVSETMAEISGLDSYLNRFRDNLARRIQGSFAPRFIPDSDSYSDVLEDVADYAAYMGNLDLFSAQKGVVQAVSNALDHNKVSFIVGEMGTGI